jgi:hypothetical protein
VARVHDTLAEWRPCSKQHAREMPARLTIAAPSTGILLLGIPRISRQSRQYRQGDRWQWELAYNLPWFDEPCKEGAGGVVIWEPQLKQ